MEKKIYKSIYQTDRLKSGLSTIINTIVILLISAPKTKNQVIDNDTNIVISNIFARTNELYNLPSAFFVLIKIAILQVR